MRYLKMASEERGNLIRWVVPALILGLLISLTIPEPVIGIIQLGDAIYPATAKDLIAQITYARDDPKIHAVVFVLDSPGGTVVDTEAVYMELTRLRQIKPVVTWVGGLAASGAYYLSSGTDYIVAVPSSEVGNVGVIGYLPPTPIVLEDTLSTGPYKLWGSPRDTTMREIEMLKQGFFQAVTLGRGDRLKIGPEILLRGQIWPGSEALQLGLVDQLGSLTDAYARAADLAHIWHYQLSDVYSLAIPTQTNYPVAFFQQTKDGAKLPYPAEPGLYMLYIPAFSSGQK